MVFLCIYVCICEKPIVYINMTDKYKWGCRQTHVQAYIQNSMCDFIYALQQLFT